MKLIIDGTVFDVSEEEYHRKKKWIKGWRKHFIEGVHHNPLTEKWHVGVLIDGKLKSLGCSDSEDVARKMLQDHEDGKSVSVKFRGVKQDRNSGKWNAILKGNVIGSFDTPEQASEFYLEQKSKSRKTPQRKSTKDELIFGIMKSGKTGKFIAKRSDSTLECDSLEQAAKWYYS